MTRSPIAFPLAVLTLSLTLGFAPNGFAGDPAVVAALQAKGAQVTETAGEITGLAFKDNKGLTDADYRQIRGLDHLKMLGCGAGLDDAGLKALAGLPALEQLSTNGMTASDEGVRTLAACKALRSIAFFHPGKSFTGTGLAALAAIPNLERLTVAGSTEFGDDGLAAVAQIAHLKEFRTWHAGATVEGIRKLQALKELKSLTIGQRLANKPPVMVSDDTVAAVAGMPSLEMLSLQEARLTLPALGKLKQLPNLKRLTLDGIDIPEAQIAELRQELPKADIKWTAPNEAARKRIDGLFGAR
ncbi:hypothetical protein CfE428DRAFT_1440 [Chthoniobacter flavus Ellin428]|uniref:Leucine Rich repeats (2 copies) n=1 Tax=Chthoniobacter flavus Ellin428 TaxID=497964 RepID=B4CXZ9_9BACT|nr:hypothetical protein [Chthoniobacter flavus]EDY21147.1 hypothetical protein CfE428DRAFT_1440 [Chthoniobacter flavus Ellin428]TCO87519.1 hypothetical protein EV701_12121 [Chthoniobacter flavus]